MDDRYDQLAKLDRLRADGVLSESEFAAEKARLLQAGTEAAYAPWGMPPRTFAMVMHLSQFAGFVVPVAGLVLPIVMWATEKDRSREIDRHGRVILNWMISSLIYTVVAIILCFVVIGFPLLIGLVVASVVFTIIGAVKASAGVCWPYPMSIRFLSLPNDEGPVD